MWWHDDTSLHGMMPAATVSSTTPRRAVTPGHPRRCQYYTPGHRAFSSDDEYDNDDDGGKEDDDEPVQGGDYDGPVPVPVPG